MWCHALLVAIPLTYVICVLLLNGLQKEDLDADVLAKLQRRNVNIDDMNNESIREKCTTGTDVGTIKERRSTFEDVVSTMSNTYEQTRQLLLQKPVINNETRRQVPDERNVSNDTTPANILQNFVNLYWEMMAKKSQIETTTIEPTTAKPTVTTSTKDNISSSANNLEYLNHMLLSYIAAKLTPTTVIPLTTTEVTTTPKLHIDIISQKIKELLEQNHNIKITTQLQTTTKESVKIESQIDNKSTSLTFKYIDEYFKLTEKNKKLGFDNNPNIYQTHKPETVPKVENNMNMESKHLTDDLIREITEKVRASVLRDLQIQISAIKTQPTTAVPENTSIMKITIESNHRNGNNIVNTPDTSHVLENMLEMFHQLKLGDNLDKTLSFTEKKDTKNEFHGPINVVYPPLIPVDYVASKAETISPISITYPYNQYTFIMPVSQKQSSPKPNEGPYKTNFESLSAFNLNPSQTHPDHQFPKSINVQTIQSEVDQIPPLMVQMPNTMSISQNIIVTTKRPYFEHDNHANRNKHRDFNEPEPGTNFYDLSRINKYMWPQDMSERELKFSPSKYANYDKEHLKNLHRQNGKHYHVGRDSRNYDRFHELLERPEGYPDFKQSNGPKPKPRLKVSSRQQLALNDIKNLPRIEDDHFKTFLKTQQKVNDMLERILATKSDTRSVEVV